MSARPAPAASVIVRCLNKDATIEATLRSLRAQTVPVEIVVVDSGSTDGTLELAARYADRILHVRPRDFTYGGALNLGAEHARAEIQCALSAHGPAPSTSWVADSVRHYADPKVAGTGARRGSDADPGVAFPSYRQALLEPGWDFSNTASSWRAEVWRLHPFREDLPACEDKEWLWWGLRHGWRFAFDPALASHSGHRRQEGLRALWRRTHREAQALTLLDRPPHPDLGDAVREWWGSFPEGSRWPRAIRRFSPHRIAERGGTYAGTRAGLRERVVSRSA